MPNDYGKIIKENFDPLLSHLLRKVLGLELPKLIDLKDKIQVTLEREMDSLKKVVHDDPALNFGLHWEIQTNDEDTRARNLLYYGLFFQNHKMPSAFKKISKSIAGTIQAAKTGNSCEKRN
jgi:hypothetical protein